MAAHTCEVKRNSHLFETLDMSQYEDFSGLYKTYHELVKNEIKGEERCTIR